MQFMEKITKREKYEAIAKAMETGECKYAPDVVFEFCENEIALLDKKAAKAKERAATKKAEAGRAEKREITIPATEGQKSRKIVGYRAIV